MSGRKEEAISLVEELLNYPRLPDWLDEHLHRLEQDFR
jgi:hypothetical protein